MNTASASTEGPLRDGAAPVAGGPSLAWQGVSKRFAGVEVLHDVSLGVQAGSCHALMGENGAGKSTLARIAAGIHRPDAGRVLLDGVPVDFRSPADALAAGLAMVHQELAFCPDLSVAENLALGRWPRRGPLVDRRAMTARAEALLSDIGVSLDTRRAMASLSTAQEQMVQIAAAVGTGARTLLFDEPTSSLSDAEAERLFALLARLRERGTTIVYVSHRLPEVLALCDRMTVLRDGALVDTIERADADGATLVRLMLGRELLDADEALAHRPRRAPPGEPVLSVRGLSSPAGPRDVSFDLAPGEVLGLAGLVGAGRSETLAALFGLDPLASGEVRVDGVPLPLRDPRAAITAGLGLVPEDRKRQGLVLGMDAVANQSLGQLTAHRRGPLVDRRAERSAAQAALARLDVRGARPGEAVATLSGGNQQKVVLARWIERGGRVLLVDEPTRGVDVGAKAAIHALLRALAAEGLAVLLVSSDLPELLALSDRVLVMREGRLTAELSGQQLDAERTLAAMAGVEAR